MFNKAYVLVTAARNEEACIEKTIISVTCQTILPKKWVIVSDGSTDHTDEIIKRYMEHHDFIQLVQRRGDVEPNFGSQVQAINVGYEHLKNLEYGFIGNLDGDVSFDPAYYETVLEKFQQNQRLGLAGGFIYEQYNGKFVGRKFNTARSVAHAIQLFRRECYEDIGGYIPLIYGGADSVAEDMARMKRWEVRAFPELKVFHHKCGLSARGIVRESIRQGLMDYWIGNHPLFEIMKCLRRAKQKPYLVVAFVRMVSFIWPYCYREKRALSDEFIKYLRKDQMNRLKTQLSAVMHQFNDSLRIGQKQ
jgi:glycosyltransferase involved in cell wall biosynthesis